jgi:hypothetical protein
VTAPALARTERVSGLRVYSDPVTGRDLPSVTSLISLARSEGLERWKRSHAVQLVVERIDEVERTVAEVGVEETVRQVLVEAGKVSEDVCRIGDEVHAYLEARAQGVEPPVVSDDARPWIAGAERFLEDFAPDFVAVEATVFNRTLGYAGTADFLAVVGGKLVIGDYKTGKAVHGEVALQLGALARAEVIVEDDGTERPMPKVETGLVVHLRPELPRGFAVRQVELAKAPWRRFRACLGLWETRSTRGFVGPVLRGPEALVSSSVDRSPATPPADLAGRVKMAGDPETAEAVLEELAEDLETRVRVRVARNPGTPRRVLQTLAQDSAWEVRYAVTENPRTKERLLCRLTGDSCQLVGDHARQILWGRAGVL